jgi:hypothetical protein
MRDAAVGAGRLREAIDVIFAMERGDGGKVRIGVMASLARRYLADLLETYRDGSVSFRGKLRSRQTPEYQKLYQAAEIRSCSAATRRTWMTRRRASETVWLM